MCPLPRRVWCIHILARFYMARHVVYTHAAFIYLEHIADGDLITLQQMHILTKKAALFQPAIEHFFFASISLT